MLRKAAKRPRGVSAGPGRPAWRPAAGEPDRLVGIGFRCWLSGYQTGDIGCWEVAWREYSSTLGVAAAKLALGELACWVRSVHQWAQRPIEVYPASCRGFCRDERMAISLIAACQHNACPAARACAFALLGSSLIEEPLEGARTFGATLDALGQRLSLDAVPLADVITGDTSGGRRH